MKQRSELSARAKLTWEAVSQIRSDWKARKKTQWQTVALALIYLASCSEEPNDFNRVETLPNGSHRYSAEMVFGTNKTGQTVLRTQSGPFIPTPFT